MFGPQHGRSPSLTMDIRTQSEGKPLRLSGPEGSAREGEEQNKNEGFSSPRPTAGRGGYKELFDEEILEFPNLRESFVIIVLSRQTGGIDSCVHRRFSVRSRKKILIIIIFRFHLLFTNRSTPFDVRVTTR